MNQQIERTMVSERTTLYRSLDSSRVDKLMWGASGDNAAQGRPFHEYVQYASVFEL